jgi:hypothetical protein
MLFESLESRTLFAAPSAPQEVRFAGTGPSTAQGSWKDVSNEEGYKVWRMIDGTNAWTKVATLPKNTIAFNDTGLAPSTKYVYHVVAYNNSGNSARSNFDSATTSAAPTTEPVPTPTEPPTTEPSPPTTEPTSPFLPTDLKPHRDTLNLAPVVTSTTKVVTWAQLIGTGVSSDTKYQIVPGEHFTTGTVVLSNKTNVVIEAYDPTSRPLIHYKGSDSTGRKIIDVQSTAKNVRIEGLDFTTSSRADTYVYVNGDDVTVRDIGVINPKLFDAYNDSNNFTKFICKTGSNADRVVIEHCPVPLASNYFTYLGEGSETIDVRYNTVGDCGSEHPLRSYASDVMVYGNKFSNKPNTSPPEKTRTAVNFKERERLSVFNNEFEGNLTFGPLPGSDGDPYNDARRLTTAYVFHNVIRQYATNDVFTFSPGAKDVHVEANLIYSTGGTLFNVDMADGSFPDGTYIRERGAPEVEIKNNLVIGRTGTVSSWKKGDTSKLTFDGNEARLSL